MSRHESIIFRKRLYRLCLCQLYATSSSSRSTIFLALAYSISRNSVGRASWQAIEWVVAVHVTMRGNTIS